MKLVVWQSMKYRFVSKFWYDEDDAALTKRLLAFFRYPFFCESVLKPRSRKFARTEDKIAELLVPTDGYLSSDFDWAVKRHGKPIAGRLNLCRNRIWTPPGFPSFVELRFSLSPKFKGGPFHNVDEVLQAAMECMTIGPSLIGVVECDDESDDRVLAKFETFRQIDEMAVPRSVEWVTVLHREIVNNMGVDLRVAKKVEGVRVGQSGDYWWVLLCDEPFSFASGVGIAAMERVQQEIGLEAIQERFRRSST